MNSDKISTLHYSIQCPHKVPSEANNRLTFLTLKIQWDDNIFIRLSKVQSPLFTKRKAQSC